ncbi:MAG: hypothetical protein K0R27_2603 [Xanthobacteraceae bacterium]|jgi:hypothetical protein|nr:hypothetical protein [Xanthobacteraceae bacterium]
MAGTSPAMTVEMALFQNAGTTLDGEFPYPFLTITWRTTV